MVRSWMSVIFAFLVVFAATACFSQNAPSQGSTPGAIDVAAVPSQSAASSDVSEDDDDSPDIPPFARSRTSEKQYLELRDQQLRLQRGLDDLVNDPQARSRAIRTMRLQEQSSRRMQTGSGVSGAAPLLPPSWSPLGPSPIPNGQTIMNTVAVSGRVTAIAIDPADASGNTVYVGTAQGGLYRSLDGGSTWTALMDTANSLAIGAITIDPNNHTTLLVGTGEGNFSLDSFFGVGLYIIQNATTTADLSGPFSAPTVSPNPDGFTDVFTGRSITKILVNPANSNQILVSTSSGFSGASGDIFSTLPTRAVYLSTNALSGSPTFARLSIQSAADKNRPVTDMVMDPNNANSVLVYVFGQTDTEGGVWASSTSPTPWSGTATWTQTFAAGVNENGKLAANHVGSITTVLLALDQVASVAPCSGKSGTLFKSTDGGATWPAELTAARGFCGGQCFYDMPVAIDPGSANNIYIGGAAGSAVGACGSSSLGKSTNGGTNFAASQSSLHADSHAIAIFPANANIIYEGNDGGIFRSADGGATWSSLNTAGFNATQFESIAVHPTDPNFTIGGTQDNGTPFLQPNGTWTRADFGDGGFSAIDQNAAGTTNVTMYHTYFNQSNNLVGFAQVTSVASAHDNGWTFFGCQGTTPGNGITCADAVLFYAPLALGPGNPNTVYYGTDRLYSSVDSGTTNTVVSQAPIVAGVAISAIGVSPQVDTVRIVGLANGQVWATTSGSSTLTNVTGGWTAKYIARTVIDPNAKFTAYVTLDGYGVATGHVWKTTNLNAATPTWIAASSGIPDVPVNGLVVDASNSNNVYVGTDIGVYNSTDGGATWNPYGSGLPRVAVFDLKITAGHKVRIATHGRGMWEIPAVGSLVTTSALSFSPPNPTFGTQVTFTATVNTGSSVIPPTGTVAFIENSTTLGTGTVVSGSATFQTSSLTVASHSITAQYSGDTNYLGSTSPAVTVTVGNAPGADYAINFPSGSQTVKAGQPAPYTVNVTTTNGFGGTINFACPSGLPSLTSCSFNPMQVTVSGNSGSTTLTIATTAPTTTPPGGNLNSGLLTGGGFLALGLALIGIAGKKRGSKSAFLLLGVLALAAVLGSCGGGGGTPPVVHNPGTPPGTYTVTVSATSGSTTHQSTITLVVQ
jgi:hypothetical protein